MLFYLALATVCVLSAMVCLWMVRSIIRVSRDAYQVFLPGAVKKRQEAKFHHLNPNLAATPVPWGWGPGSVAPRMVPEVSRVEPAAPLAPVPWGWGRDYPGRRPVPVLVTQDMPVEVQPVVPWGWAGSAALQSSNGDWIHRGLEGSAAAQSVRNLIKAQDPFTKQLGHGDSVVQWTYRKDANRSPAQRESRQDWYAGSDLGVVTKPWGW